METSENELFLRIDIAKLNTLRQISPMTRVGSKEILEDEEKDEKNTLGEEIIETIIIEVIAEEVLGEDGRQDWNKIKKIFSREGIWDKLDQYEKNATYENGLTDEEYQLLMERLKDKQCNHSKNAPKLGMKKTL